MTNLLAQAVLVLIQVPSSSTAWSMQPWCTVRPGATDEELCLSHGHQKLLIKAFQEKGGMTKLELSMMGGAWLSRAETGQECQMMRDMTNLAAKYGKVKFESNEPRNFGDDGMGELELSVTGSARLLLADPGNHGKEFESLANVETEARFENTEDWHNRFALF